MSQGTVINNNPRLRQQLPRQVAQLIDGTRNQFPRSGFVLLPFDQSELEPQAGRPRREQEGSGALVFVLFLVLALAGGIYWFSNNSTSNSTSNPPSNSIAGSNTPVTEVRRVDVFELNMREMPNLYSPVKFILPLGTSVHILNENQQELDGDVWVKIRVQTREGLQDGWVNARYIR